MKLTDFFPSIGFIGAGNMAGAIIRAIVRKGMPPGVIAAVDVDESKTDELKRDLGIWIPKNAGQLIANSSAIVLAVKPQSMAELLDSIKGSARPGQLYISIAAGVSTASIESRLPALIQVVRVMPNTPAMVGEGAAGVAGGRHATDADVQAVVALFSAVGRAVRVEENMLDAVTALSGSGPAYIFRVMEVMQSAAEGMGLAPDLARTLTLQTVLGAARLAVETGEDPAELRRRVTSPGGTTAAALAVMEERDLPGLFHAALTAARDRSVELAAQA